MSWSIFSFAGLALDEFTQVLRHGAFGQTEIKNYRKVILATLGQKLLDVLSHQEN